MTDNSVQPLGKRPSACPTKPLQTVRLCGCAVNCVTVFAGAYQIPPFDFDDVICGQVSAVMSVTAVIHTRARARLRLRPLKTSRHCPNLCEPSEFMNCVPPVHMQLTDPSKGKGPHVDAVFAPVGGGRCAVRMSTVRCGVAGGLLSGTYLATTAQAKHSRTGKHPLVFGAEPLAGNDAVRSLQTGSIGNTLVLVARNTSNRALGQSSWRNSLKR